jgi:hypothetical protein
MLFRVRQTSQLAHNASGSDPASSNARISLGRKNMIFSVGIELQARCSCARKAHIAARYVGFSFSKHKNRHRIKAMPAISHVVPTLDS